MNLAIDIGNTAVKWALFEGSTLVETGVGSEGLAAKCQSAGRMLACASGEVPTELASVPRLTGDMQLPIRLDYKTPDTLGPDRIAAACGAWALHPAEASLIIDAGTCITVDYLDAEGVYHGGAIMPGLAMSLQALHERTARLPLVEPSGAPRIPGRTTEESIVAGTLGATMLALAGFVTLYRQRSPELHVLLTGGDARRLTAAGVAGWEAVDNLTLRGLNEIMLYNDK